MIYDTIIVGAGAAGLFSAASYSPGTKGLILEKTKKAGTKLLMSGSGQCNFTHSGSIKDFLTRYGPNGTKLRPILYPFHNLALMDYFQSKGIALRIREDGKVFPDSLRAQDILDVLMHEAKQKGFLIKYETPVTDIKWDDPLYSVYSGKEKWTAKKLIVATGGRSYPATGSDGSMYAILKSLDIQISTPKPALVPIFAEQYPYSDLAGISFENAAVSVKNSRASNSDKPATTLKGALLFTHDAFSGPVILDASRYAHTGAQLLINYIPDQKPDDLAKLLKNQISGNKKQVETMLSDALGIPRRFADCICMRLGISGTAASLSGSQIQKITSLLTCDAFSISGVGGFNSAMATAGGVLLDEIHLKTMESKKYPRMHIIGEALDVDGDTGGYNLQFAFSSGFAAAQNRPAQSEPAKS